MKLSAIILLFLISSTAQAYCVKYNSYGQCVQQDQYSTEKQERQQNNLYIKPLPTIPPVGTNNCQWVVINGQWQSVCY